jgi:hypothetical protein
MFRRGGKVECCPARLDMGPLRQAIQVEFRGTLAGHAIVARRGVHVAMAEQHLCAGGNVDHGLDAKAHTAVNVASFMRRNAHPLAPVSVTSMTRAAAVAGVASARCPLHQA